MYAFPNEFFVEHEKTNKFLKAYKKSLLGLILFLKCFSDLIKKKQTTLKPNDIKIYLDLSQIQIHSSLKKKKTTIWVLSLKYFVTFLSPQLYNE